MLLFIVFIAGQDPDKRTKVQLTDEDLTAQALIFFLGGFEVIANTMCLAAHELAINQEAQERLQKEIDCSLEQSKGKLSYEDLSRMKYLDMVISGQYLDNIRKLIITCIVC